MKKKIIGALVVVAIAVGAMINVNLNKSSNKGDLTMANVEALADGETGTGARSCTLSWSVTFFGVTTAHSCSVTCDVGFNAVCELKECKCVAV